MDQSPISRAEVAFELIKLLDRVLITIIHAQCSEDHCYLKQHCQHECDDYCGLHPISAYISHERDSLSRGYAKFCNDPPLSIGDSPTHIHESCPDFGKPNDPASEVPLEQFRRAAP